MGLQSPRQSRLYFFVPWRGAVMAGTYYREHQGAPGDLRVTEQDIEAYLDALNSCLPGAAVTRNDILAIHAGIVPSRKPARPDCEPDLLRHYKLMDHARLDGIQGLLSVCGIKYTTARGVAEEVVDLAASRLAKTVRPSATRHTPLPGGDIPDLAAFRRDMAAAHPSIAPGDLDRLLALYGTEAREIFALAENRTDPDVLLRAECLFALRNEMPQTLGDLVFRRISLASTGRPAPDRLRLCAETMGRERNWSANRIQAETDAVLHAPTLWQAAASPPE